MLFTTGIEWGILWDKDPKPGPLRPGKKTEAFKMDIAPLRRLTSFQIIILLFAAVILAGALLLMLPFASQSGRVTPFDETLFTATSAVCVTGLVVQDTATYWSYFGQAVILLLIQIGGLGVVTVASAIALLAGRRISLMQRGTMQEAISAPKVGGIVRLTGFILRAVFLIEGIGAACLAPVFVRDFGLRGVWMAVFHSISAFCNAGFDLMGAPGAEYASLTAYRADPVVNLVIMGLIVVGGIGFLTWDDIRTNGRHLHHYRMQSKVILATTGALIVIPAMFYYFMEFGRAPWGDMGAGERALVSVFQSITPRTAGFNTVDLTAMSEPSLSLMILLMLTGGSPGSTAGGMKTTTVAVLMLSAISVFQRRETVRCFGRRIDVEAVRSAATVLLMYLTLFLLGALIISQVEGLPMLTCLFETASAIGTVGLTLGVTPELSMVSRVVLMALMFMGRVGGLTLVFAAVSEKRRYVSTMPKEKITVG